MPHSHPHQADDATEHVIRLDRGAGVTRRQALAAMAASMALANTACSPPPVLQAHPYVDLPEARGGGLPLYYATAFVRDGFAMGVLVGTQEGRPIKIEGNAAHPSSLGATDIFAQASVLQLWDPDRSAAVRQRLARGGDARTPSNPGVSTWSAFEAAWRARTSTRAQTAGATLRVLTGPITSPTERALIARLIASEPGAHWHVHAPLMDAATAAGARMACGQPAMPVLHFDQARCVFALAADPFSDGPGAVRHAMDWSTARAATRDSGAGRAATLFAVEATPGLFGARADHRVALSPDRIEALLWRVAAHWMTEITAAPVEAATAAFEARLVTALQAAGTSAMVVAGAGLSAEAHALVFALNERLGAIGRTITLITPPDFAPDAGTLPELVDALNAGSVDTLLVLGVNPAYDAAPSLAAVQALARAKLLVHAGLHVDETAALADWHLPLSHVYEQWGDALAHDGSATLLQPAISPLYDTRSTAELLALLSDDTIRDGHSLVQRQWRAGRETDFDAFWRRSLRAGVVVDSAAPALRVQLAQRPPVRPAPRAGPTALFVPDAAAHDGAYANNGWLQELPRPFTKLTWDNAALLSPATARRLGVETGDIVQVQVDTRSVEAPAWVLAQQADDVVTLPLGCGRRRAGRVGNGVGFDAYALRPHGATTAAVALRKTGRTHAFAVTQHEIDQHGRELLRTVAAGSALPKPETHAQLYPPFASPVHAWAMVIDLDACIGCNACTIACQAENNIPVVGKEQVAKGRDMHWIRVDRHDLDDIDNSAFQPVPCMHCEEAPCEVVCPVGATVHDSEGLNVQVYNRCVGTRFCSNNCPYKVRRFNFLQFSDETTETLKAQRNPDVTVRQRGVMEKCTYCVQRIARGRQAAERDGRPLVDGDVVTACQSACPTRAIRFGDKNDVTSDVVQARASQRHYAMLEELDTKPRTTYLARIKPTA